MRPAAKHWLLLLFLAVTLAAMVAFALWQMGKARERGAQPPQAGGSPRRAPVSALGPSLQHGHATA